VINQPNDILDMSVIIPFKDKAKMTIDCVGSFLTYGPKVKEIILISNNSSPEELQQIKDYSKPYEFIHIYEYNFPFNYQKMNNWAVKKSTGKMVMYLNNDTELREASRGLVEKMYEKAQQKDVGICGCLLLFGDSKTIQHGGVFLMPEGQADHMYAGKRYSDVLHRKNSKEFPYDITKDIPMSAVTGAVQIVSRSKLEEIGYMDERFIIGGGDVDLCLRMNQKGYQTWFIAGGYILHKESQSRKNKPIPYMDFYWSYLSYIKGFDPKVGDPFLPKITEHMKINGA
jgi:GT2 family glycosyltransferase